MAVSRQVLESFLKDSLRLSGEARRLIGRMHEQSVSAELSEADVQQLFRIVHTLKGTASMLPESREVVNALHELEGRLACRSAAESAKDPEWLGLAERSLSRGERVLRGLEKSLQEPVSLSSRRSMRTRPRTGPGIKGLLTRARVGHESKLLWFPLVALIRVFSPEELAGRPAVCLQGSWVPVLGQSAGKQAPFYGVGVQAGSGQAVIAVEEILGTASSDEAERRGALTSFDIPAYSA